MQTNIDIFFINLSRLYHMEGIQTKFWTKRRIFYLLGGLVVGFLSGFFGGGGGMVVVPLLTLVGKMQEKKAHATAMAVILPLSVVGGVVYLLSGRYDLSVGLPTGIAFIVGSVVGSLFLKKISNKVLGIVFSVLMIIGGVRLLW